MIVRRGGAVVVPGISSWTAPQDRPQISEVTARDALTLPLTKA